MKSSEFYLDRILIHYAIDRAVLDTYGWSDLEVPPFCPANDKEQAALKRFEAEVIDRLFALNAERAAEEERLGLGQKRAKKAKEAVAEKAAAKSPRLKPPTSVYPPAKTTKHKPSAHKHMKRAG